MKILVVGLGRRIQHEHSVVQSLSSLFGVDAHAFFYGCLLMGRQGYLAERLLFGPKITFINEILLNKCKEEEFDVVFLYRALLISPKTIQKIRDLGCKVVTFNPDTIYGTNGAKSYFNFYRKSLKIADHNFVYRTSDLEKYQSMGIQNVSILRSFFIPKQLESFSNKRFSEKVTDVGFYGHCEPDGRVDYIKKMFEKNYDLRVNGRDWNKFYKFPNGKNRIGGSLSFLQYNNAIRETKCCLCFFSSWNEDGYTRRVFEIPAAGSLLVAQRTDEMLNIYSEEEAVYFGDFYELSRKIDLLVNNESAWTNMLTRSQEKLFSNGHDIKSRMNEFLNKVSEL